MILGNIEEATIIDEEPTLNDSLGSNSFIGWIAGTVDNLTEGNRGSWVTEAIILAGYAENKEALRDAYFDNKPAIDRYFSKVDVEKIINDVGPGLQKKITQNVVTRVKNNVPGFLLGSLITAGTIYGIKKYKEAN